MPLSSQEEEDLRRLKSDRSAQQGVVRGFITKLLGIINENNHSRATECDTLAKRLLTQKEKYEDAYGKVIHLMTVLRLDTQDVEDKNKTLKDDVIDTYKKASDWVLFVQSQEHMDTSSGDVTIIESPHDKDDEIDMLKHQVDDLRDKLTELDDTRYEMGSVKNSLSHAEKQLEEEKRHYAENMMSIRAELDKERRELERLRLHMSTSTPKADARRTQPQFEETGLGNRTNLDQEDILAISQIVAHSNAEIVKRVLDTSVDQHKTFYQSMQTPKIEVPTFNGDYTTYHSFINRYDDLVGLTSSTDSVKLNTLLQSCSKDVMKHLDCCNYRNSKDGYALARNILKTKYGNPFLIAQAWVEKIMAHPKLTKADEISLFSAELRSCYHSLTSLGFLSDMENTGNMREIINKVPMFVQNRWRKKHREQMDANKRATLEDMINIIASSAEELSDPIYGSGSLSKLGTKSEKDAVKKTTKSYKGHVGTVQADTEEIKDDKQKPKRAIKCAFCGEGHYPRLCSDFVKKNPTDRLKMVKDKGLCMLCLNPFHTVANCNMKWSCQEAGCTRRHNTMLHSAFSERRNENDKSDDVAGAKSSDVVAHVAEANGVVYHNHSSESFSLPVIPVYVEGKKGVFDTNVLMDTGATLTFITESFFKKLAITPYDTSVLHMTSMTGKESFEARLVNFNIKPSDNNVWQTLFDVAVVKELPISGRYVTRLQYLDRWPYLKELNIKYVKSQEVDILVGQNNAKMFKRLMEVGGSGSGQPWAIRTPLGWMIMGHYVKVVPDEPSFVSVEERKMMADKLKNPFEPFDDVFVCSQTSEIERNLEILWAIDPVPEAAQESPVDVNIKKMWDEKARVVDGHLEIPIPFKNEPPFMPDNKAAVEKRMKSLGKRLQREPELKKKCFETMKNDFDQGYAEVSPKETVPGYKWFVPIQPVVTYTDKRPGKCRLVGDLSHRCDDKCLNEEVYQGPNYTKSLYEMLIMFRQYRYAITGDIKGMFNQVRVPEHQRPCLSFLWWLNENLDEELTECRMKTQMFGGTWCPSIAQYALEWVALNPSGQYELEVLETVLRHFYVDDMLRSIWEEELGFRLLMESRRLLQEIGFELCKLGSSSMKILEKIPIELRAKEYQEVEFELHNTVATPMLGSSWKPGPDEFGFKADVKQKAVTKRGVLSGATSLFDPLGLVAPFVLRAKSLIQELCKEKFEWDYPLPAIYNNKWTVWLEELPTVRDFKVPRWIGMDKDPDHEFRLQVFTDASTKGYGAVIYLVGTAKNGEVISSRLITSKAKVAPIKTVTVPRLELCASVLGVKMEAIVHRSLGENLKESCFWTDSVIVLWYVRGQSWRYKTFVSNRIAYIQERTERSQWFYVPTDKNVADHVSRGMTAAELIASDEWKEGPLFIRGKEELPTQPELLCNEKDPEARRLNSHVMTAIVEKKLTSEDKRIREKYLMHHSKWDTLVRRVCVWRRIVHYMKTKKRRLGFFTVEERSSAQNLLFEFIQSLYFTSEQKDTKVFKKLFPYNNDGLYRVGGRLVMSTMDYEAKHPPILPPSEPTNTFVRYVHDQFGHGGVDRTFHDVRQKVWIVGGKRTIKAAIGDCMICRKIKAPMEHQVMSPLPKFRIEEGTVPFDVVGVDYFGPMYVKVGRALHKRYICLFTDMKIRASHVEVAHEMTTSSFIMALQRFIARRGKPSMIISDNGTNFVGANRELKAMYRDFNQDYIGNKLAEQGIRWQFNTPLASHHGGSWERLIRSFRVLFMAIAGSQTLTDESLATFAAGTEQVMNSRPLTKVSEDPEDEEVLTPDHLINLRKTSGLPGKFDGADALRQKWKQVLYLSQQFWSKWLRVYLQSLQLRHKWVKPKRDMKVNDIVLVLDESVRRLEWPLGRIIEVFPGKDGHVRSASVKTKTGIYQRPITKLVFLEASD